MRRRIAILTAAVMALSACQKTEQAVTTTTTATTTAAETTTTTTAVTTTAETTTPETSATEEIVSESVDYSGFSLKDYYTQDKNAKPVSIDGMGGMLNGLYEDKMEIARKAVCESDYYAEAVRQAKELFDYRDGVYALKSDEPAFYSNGYEGYLDTNEAYKINPRLVYTMPAYFNRDYREYLFVFSMPLPVSYAEWSGEDMFYVTVFVNYSNKAVIIPECSKQTLRSVEPIHADNIQLLFQSGHSQGTGRSVIIGFDMNGYKVEYTGSAVHYTPSGANYILDDISVWSGYYKMLFCDEEKGYCEVRSEPLSGEAMDIICSSPDVLEAYPDIYDMCNDGQVHVIGGKYITVGAMGTFSFENGVFEPFDGIICPSEQEDAMNIIAMP